MSGAIVKLIFGHRIKFSRLKKYYRQKVYKMTSRDTFNEKFALRFQDIAATKLVQN